MMNRVIASTLLCTAALAAPRPIAAQQRASPVDSAADRYEPASRQEEPVRPPLRPLRVAKWSALAATLAAAGYGFSVHDDANEAHGQLEEVCRTEPDRCRDRTSDGAYRDAELERMHRNVARLDDRAALALAGSQLALAGSVVLFILDLRESDSPPNVIYEPSGLRVLPRDGGAELRLRLPLGPR